MADYADILSRGWDEIPEVRALPCGSWLLRGKNASYQPPKSESGSPSVLFVHAPVEPMENVDDAELNDLGKDYDYATNKVFSRFWIETGADWDVVRRFLKAHGIDLTGKSIEDGLKAFKGAEVIANLDKRTYENSAGELVEENTAKNFTPVE